MSGFKFDPAKTARLDDPARLDDLLPDVMWDVLDDPDPSVIVEIGAGTGLMSEQFARLAPRAIVYAADTQQSMLDWIARVRAGLVDDARIVPVLASETSVPLPDGVAGVVAMVNLHHELDDPAATYADAARLLAPGGRLLIVDWARRESPHGPPLTVRADPADIVAVAERAGFESVREHEGLPYHTLITGRKPLG